MLVEIFLKLLICIVDVELLEVVDLGETGEGGGQRSELSWFEGWILIK